MKKNKSSVKIKLIVVMLLVAIIPVTVSTTISYVTSLAKAYADAEESLSWQAWYIQDRFSSIVNQNLRAMETVAKAPSIISYLEGNTDNDTKNDALEYLGNVDDMFDDGNATIIVNLDGMQLLRKTGDCVDVSDREYYNQGIAGNLYVSDAFESKSTGVRMIAMVAPITDSDGNVIGIVQRNYELNDFHEFLAGEQVDAFICDRTGIVAAHSQYEFNKGDELEDRSQSEFMTSGEAEGIYTTDTGKGYTAIVGYVRMGMGEAYEDTMPLTGWSVCTAVDLDSALGASRMTAMLIILISIIFIIVAIIVSIRMALSFTRPIEEMNNAIMALAEGSFVKINKYTNRRDEFGTMLTSMNEVTDKLSGIIGETKAMAGDLKESGDTLAYSSGQASDASGNVNQAIENISRGSATQADNVHTAVESTDSMGRSIDTVADEVTQLNDYAKDMKNACDMAMTAMNELIRQSEEVTRSVNEISNVIKATSESASDISSFTDAIQDIASQTNLLSLNASIEAARAGEQGKGFAVVADEIGGLANQSADSANRIKEVVDKLLADVSSSVDVMGQLNTSFSEQSEKLAMTKDNMGSLLGNVNNVSDSVSNIESRVGELNKAKTTMVSIIEALSAVSVENAASTQETTASMAELNDTFSLFSQSAMDLQKLADNLNETMSYFRNE